MIDPLHLHRELSIDMLYYLGLGSNLGDRRARLDEALRLLAVRVGEVVAVSSYIETEPWGFASDHAFLNAACAVRSALIPHDVLLVTQAIERDMGRVSKSVRATADGVAPAHYTDRPIDIDLLLCYDDQGQPVTVSTADLQIPHPLMGQRDFVRIPLAELGIEIPKVG